MGQREHRHKAVAVSPTNATGCITGSNAAHAPLGHNQRRKSALRSLPLDPPAMPLTITMPDAWVNINGNGRLPRAALLASL
jgi:hypothetical protein